MNVKPEHTISWSIQPHKKSLNFGLFKHPGHPTAITPTAAAFPILSPPIAQETNPIDQFKDAPKDAPTPKDATASSVVEKLKSIGLRPIMWVGRLEADKIARGEYNVPISEGGNYALVLDNTFSKTVSKTATFVLLTYPSDTPPQSGAQLQPSQQQTAGAGLGLVGVFPSKPGASPGLKPVGLSARESADSLKQAFKSARRRSLSNSKNRMPPPPPPQPSAAPKTADSSSSDLATSHAGVLQKRRRKRHQGYARRYFSLDFTTSTLSYYHDRNSSALRGAIPLSLAVIGANSASREISIDSGAEIWHLKANNAPSLKRGGMLWRR